MFIDYYGALNSDGVIGYNLFSHNVVNLDFDRRTLTVSDTLPSSAIQSKAVDIKDRDGLAFIELILNPGPKQVKDAFAIDTGFGGTAIITASSARADSLPGNLEQIGSGRMGGTGSGTIEVTKVRIPTLWIGNSWINDVPIDVQQNEPRSFKTWNIIGTDLLRRMNVTWDIPNHKIYFAKNHHFSDAFEVPKNPRKRLPWLVGSLALVVMSAIWVLRRRSK